MNDDFGMLPIWWIILKGMSDKLSTVIISVKTVSDKLFLPIIWLSVKRAAGSPEIKMLDLEHGYLIGNLKLFDESFIIEINLYLKLYLVEEEYHRELLRPNTWKQDNKYSCVPHLDLTWEMTRAEQKVWGHDTWNLQVQGSPDTRKVKQKGFESTNTNCFNQINFLFNTYFNNTVAMRNDFKVKLYDWNIRHIYKYIFVILVNF